MRQKGSVLEIIVILIVLAAVGSFTYQIYKKNKDQAVISQTQNTNTPTNSVPSQSAEGSSLITKSPSPTVYKPSPTTKIQSTPTSTPSPTTQVYSGTCQINTLAGSNPNEVVLTYGLNTTGNRYMTEARWDLNNDGQWDSDFSASNAKVTFSLPSGTSRMVRMQLMLNDGSLTNVCTANVTAPSGSWITVWGYVFSDNNCNGFMESGESGISNVPVTVVDASNYNTYGTATTDSSGKYSYTTLLNNVVSMTVSMVSPSGYKSNPSHIIGTYQMGPGKNTNVQMNIPQVPNANIGQCNL